MFYHLDSSIFFRDFITTNTIKNYLKKYNLNFKEQFKLNNSKYKLDFYLVDYNLAIEYDGIYHFKTINKSSLKETKKRDFIKNKLCFIYKINLIRIPYHFYDNLDQFIKKILIREKILTPLPALKGE